MDQPILQSHLPSAPWMQPAQRRLPGIQPLDPADWLVVDDAFAGQMALRERLLDERRAAVLAEPPEARAAAEELLATVLRHLGPGYRRDGDIVRRPDGRTVALDADTPLATAGRLVQEDLCLLQRPEGAAEHRLSAAILCFPANWTLAEKLGRPLAAIHIPVDSYTDEMAQRVQRMFDMIRPDRPLWRQNALLYADPALFQPASEATPRVVPKVRPAYLRSERQCLLRLPETGAVVFSIHTYVLPFAALDAAQAAALEAHPIHYAGRSA